MRNRISDRRKTVLSLLLLLAIGGATIAAVVKPFKGWDKLIDESPDIVILRCLKTPPLINVDSNGIVVETVSGMVTSDITVVAKLKGQTNAAPAHLVSKYRPCQNHNYLVFGSYHDGEFQALEKYRIVPLGLDVPTNVIAGKALDEQIQVLLHQGIVHLKAQQEQIRAETERLGTSQ